MIGESPTRPGIFHDSPLVVVTDAMSPVSGHGVHVDRAVGVRDAARVVVDVRAVTHRLPDGRRRRLGRRRRARRIDGIEPVVARVELLTSSAASRRGSAPVRRFCSLNPISSANFLAPAPTSMMWSVWSITALATAAGVAMSSERADRTGSLGRTVHAARVQLRLRPLRWEARRGQPTGQSGSSSTTCHAGDGSVARIGALDDHVVGHLNARNSVVLLGAKPFADEMTTGRPANALA